MILLWLYHFSWNVERHKMIPMCVFAGDKPEPLEKLDERISYYMKGCYDYDRKWNEFVLYWKCVAIGTR